MPNDAGRYPECDVCLFDGSDTFACCVSKLALAWNNFLDELFLNKHDEPIKTCNWFMEDTYGFNDK